MDLACALCNISAKFPRYIFKGKGLKQLGTYVRFGGSDLGRVAKGVNCTVTGCGKDAVRSLPADKVSAAGLKVGETRRAYLCKEHYKEFKRETKKERKLEQWRHGTL